jgi:lipopolysaccharide transport system permease protein
MNEDTNRKTSETCDAEESWDLIIRPKTKLLSIDYKELWRYRDLLVMYVKRDIVTFYKQTILGPLWFVIQPLLTTLMFMFVFGGIAGISTDGLPQALFYMAGLLCWNYFADCLNRTSDTFNANQHVFGKVYFPRLVVPISIVISNLIKLGIQFCLFLAIYLYYIVCWGYSIEINAYAWLAPFMILLLAGLGLGTGLIITSLTTKYRDLKFLVSFGVQLWMYATPIIYPLSVMRETKGAYMWAIWANPLTGIIETFKFGFLGQGTFHWYAVGYCTLVTAIVLLCGILTFNKVQRAFMDVI